MLQFLQDTEGVDLRLHRDHFVVIVPGAAVSMPGDIRQRQQQLILEQIPGIDTSRTRQQRIEVVIKRRGFIQSLHHHQLDIRIDRNSHWLQAALAGLPQGRFEMPSHQWTALAVSRKAYNTADLAILRDQQRRKPSKISEFYRPGKAQPLITGPPWIDLHREG